MTIEQMGSIGEVIGGIAVVISLVALTFQMRQNTKAIHAESARDAESTWATFYFEIAKDVKLTNLATRLIRGENVDNFDEDEQSQVHYLLRCIWSHLQSEYYLYTEGSLKEQVWKRRAKWFSGLIKVPAIGRFFEEERRQSNIDPQMIHDIMKSDSSIDIRGGFFSN
jgi:hypothetical protein